jgi:hypothetical protein
MTNREMVTQIVYLMPRAPLLRPSQAQGELQGLLRRVAELLERMPSSAKDSRSRDAPFGSVKMPASMCVGDRLVFIALLLLHRFVI